MRSSENYFPQHGNKPEATSHEPLERCVRKIATYQGLPAISQHIQEIMAISSNERASLSQCANVILKNVSLTTKLLRLVNTVYFSQQRQVYSVSHAIRILGWNAICDTAASIMFLDDFGKKSETVRRLLQLSVLTANNAMEIASRCRYPRLEEAYLCGMFSVFGELLVATYQSEEYAEILQLMDTSRKDQSAASYSVLSFTFAQLGKAMLKHWGMPDRLAAGTLRLDTLPRSPESEGQWLSLIAAFSRELTDKVFRLGWQKGNATWIKPFLATYGALLEVTEENVEEILSQSYTQTVKAFAYANISTDKMGFEPSAHRSVTEKAKQEAEDAGAVEALKDEETKREKEILRRFAEEVVSILHSDEQLEVNDIVTIIMEAIYRGAGFDRVLFCLMNQQRTQVQARLAVGPGADELKQKFIFPISFLEGPVGPAMLKGRDVFVEDIATSRYRLSEFAGAVGARSLMMVPVKINHQVIGCLYADRIVHPLVLDEEEKGLLLKMRDQLCEEMASRKQ